MTEHRLLWIVKCWMPKRIISSQWILLRDKRMPSHFPQPISSCSLSLCHRLHIVMRTRMRQKHKLLLLSALADWIYLPWIRFNFFATSSQSASPALALLLRNRRCVHLFQFARSKWQSLLSLAVLNGCTNTILNRRWHIFFEERKKLHEYCALCLNKRKMKIKMKPK